jgi:hypothetical protein
MYNLLTRKEFPYLFTILIGIVGFQINYLIEATVSKPILKYEMRKISEELEEKEGKVLCRYQCELTNITSNRSFKNIKLDITFKEGEEAEIKNPDTIIVPPSALKNVESVSYNDRIIRYDITHFQPGFKYLFTFDTKMGKCLDFAPLVYFQSDDTLEIKEKSLLTWLIEKQFLVNLLLVLIFIGLLFTYLIMISKKEGPSR